MDQRRIIALAAVAVFLVSGAPERRESSADVRPGAARLEQGGSELERIALAVREENPHLSERDLTRIAAAVLEHSEKYGLDPELVTAVIRVESDARPWVRSPKGAVGLMQVMPHMARRFDLAGDLTRIESNIELGCLILADNIRRLGLEDGISSYFWGSRIRGASYLNRVLAERDAVRRLSES